MIRPHLKRAGLWQDAFAGERAVWFSGTVDLLRSRYRTLVDFTTYGKPYFVDDLSFEYEEAAVKKNLQKDPSLKTLLPELAERFAGLEVFDHATTEAALRELAEARGVKSGLLINSSRTALTGQAVGPGMFEVICAIGQGRTVERLRHAATLI
jgi:glutamyl-tRNA synthetase